MSPIAFALALSLRSLAFCLDVLFGCLGVFSPLADPLAPIPLHLCTFFLWEFSFVFVLLNLLGCQIPTQLLPHSFSSTEQRENIRWKSMWVAIKAGTSPTNYSQGKSRLRWGKLVQLFAKENQSRMVRNRKTPSLHPLLLPRLNFTPLFLTFLFSICPMTGRMGGEWDFMVSPYQPLLYSFNILNFIDGQ